MLLARPGLRVLVLDRMRPGADTLSTHALMRAGALQLQRWGLLDLVVAAGTPPVRRTVFHYGDGETVHVSIKPAAGVDALYAPRRTVLDPILAEEAERCGATVEFGVAVTSVLRGDDGRVAGVRVRDAAGRGARGTRRPRRGRRRPRRRSSPTRGGRLHARGRPQRLVGRLRVLRRTCRSTGYEWFWSLRRSAGVIPTTGGLSCVFVGAPPGDVAALRRRAGPAGALPRARGADLAGAGRAARAATPVERLRHDSGRPGHLRTASGPGWALVGDAGYWKDPLSTHGITDAAARRRAARPRRRLGPRGRGPSARPPVASPWPPTRPPVTGCRCRWSTWSSGSPPSTGTWPAIREPAARARVGHVRRGRGVVRAAVGGLTSRWVPHHDQCLTADHRA